MFTRLTKTSWPAKVVLVLAAIAFLVPTFFVQAQEGRLDTGGDQTFTPTGTTGGDDVLFGQPVIPPTDLIGGDDVLFGQPIPSGTNNFSPTDGQGQEGGADVGTDSGNPASTGGPTASSYNAANQAAAEAAFSDAPLKKYLYLFVVTFFGWLVWAGGYLLDFAVTNFVINFGLEFNTSGVGVAVNALWSLVRDFFNILFIFGFIWIGFQMILDSGNSQAKKTLVSLIMAALLVNFSLFISKFVVDFSNRLASEVALAGFPAINPDDRPFISIAPGSDQVDISNTFFAHLGIARTLQVPQGISNGEVEPWAFIFGSAIFYLVAAFVFAAGGVMLIIRFVALSIFMVLSPFMFLGWVFPGMQGWTSKYWKGFLGRSFYAPVYIILLFFAATILQNMFGDGGSSRVVIEGQQLGLLSAVTNNSDNLTQVLGPFVLSAAFMLAAVIVAGKMSADGAGGVMKVGGNLAQRGRRTLTYLPRRGAQVAIGRGVGGGLERLEQSNSRLAGAARRTMAVASLGALDARGRQRAAKQARDAKFGTNYSTADNLQNVQTQKQISTRRVQRSEDEEAIKAAEKAGDAATSAQLDAAEQAANRYTQDELEKMDSASRDKIVKHLKANTVAKLLDSDKLSVDEKKSTGKAYRDKINKQILENGEVITEEFEKLTDKQLEILGVDFANEHADLFTESQMDGYKKSDSLTERQKDAQKGLRKNKRMVAAHSPAGLSQMFNGRKVDIDPSTGLPRLNSRGERIVIPGNKPRKASELAGLPFEAFIQGGTLTPEAEKAMSADLLKQISRNANQGKSSISDDQRRELASVIAGSSLMVSNPGIANYLNSNKGKEDFLLKI